MRGEGAGKQRRQQKLEAELVEDRKRQDEEDRINLEMSSQLSIVSVIL